MPGPQFIALSTGRAGSRYLAGLLNRAGVPTIHERNMTASPWTSHGALGEVTAWFVTQMEACPSAQVWHFSRHPQPFVSSLMKFGFWKMHAPAIHPYLRRTGDRISDSFRYWVDWNRRILAIPHPRRTTFRIEDVDRDLIQYLAHTIGFHADVEKIDPVWTESQEFAPIPHDVAWEVGQTMRALGYA